MMNEKIKFKRGLKPARYFIPFSIFALCFGIVFRLIEFNSLKGENLMMLILSIFFFAYASYFLSALVLSARGRYLVVSDEDIYIAHEYVPYFDKIIKLKDIKMIERGVKPVDIITLLLEDGRRIILSSELLLENSISEVYEVIDEKIKKLK